MARQPQVVPGALYRRIAITAAVTLMAGLLPAITIPAHAAACSDPNPTLVSSGTGKVYALEKFTTPGTCTWTRPTGSGDVTFLVVGGGGAAGVTAIANTVAYPGGGGGGGGVGVYDPIGTATANAQSFDLKVGSGGTLGGGGAQPATATSSQIINGGGGATYFTAGAGGAGGNGDALANALAGFSGELASTGGSGGGGGASDSNSASAGQGGSSSVPPNSSGGKGGDGAPGVQNTQSGGGGGAGGNIPPNDASGNASGTTAGAGKAVPAEFAAAFANGTVLAPGGSGGVKGLSTTPTRSNSYGAGGNAYSSISDIAKSTGNGGIIVVRYSVPITVTGITPSQTDLNTVESVTITGTGFDTTTTPTVDIGNSQCSNVTVTSTTQITCTAPAFASAGTNAVSVTSQDNRKSTQSISYQVNPEPPPAIPSQPTAVAGDGEATITVEKGPTAGGIPTSYTVTSQPDSLVCTISSPSGANASGSCTITGLTNGTSYTFTATATNNGGTSLPSAASASVTPTTSGGGGGGGSASPTPSPNPTSPPAPSPAPAPVVIALAANSVNVAATAVTVNGNPTTLTAEKIPAPVVGASSNGVAVTAAGMTAAFEGPPIAGVRKPNNPILIVGQPVSLALAGLLPGSSVGLYAMPSGILIATLTVDANGLVIDEPVLTTTAASDMSSIQITGTIATGEPFHLAIGATVTPAADPVETPNGSLPEPPMGGSYVMVNQVPVPTEPEQIGSTLNVTEQQATVTMRADTSAGDPLPIGGDGALQIQEDGSVRVKGLGMTKTVDVFAFSEPTYIGRVMVNSDGTFVGSLPVPTTLGVGRHTLQLVGEARNGKQVAVALGIEKKAKTTQKRKIKKASAVVLFPSGSAMLTGKAKTELRRLVKRTGTFALRVQSIGYVQRWGSSSNDAALSAARAKAVSAYLRSLGLRGDFAVRGKGAAGPKTNDRKATVTIKYQLLR